jgi:hypothetical protein
MANAQDRVLQVGTAHSYANTLLAAKYDKRWTEAPSGTKDITAPHRLSPERIRFVFFLETSTPTASAGRREPKLYDGHVTVWLDPSAPQGLRGSIRITKAHLGTIH